MAALPVDAAREAAMSEELTRFWSSMGRRFEWERPNPQSFLGRPLARANTWEDLVAPLGQTLPDAPQYSKEDVAKEEVEEQAAQVDGFLAKAGLESDLDLQEDVLQGCVSRSDSPADCVVDGARIGDVPARYVVRGLQGHELPVVGTYVDPNIVTGFCYQVRPVDAKKALFQGRALRLVSVGMGYGKRITFASDKHNINDNYFWSDTHPEGYGFALRLVQEGDKFTLRDANGYSVATAEVIGLLGPQTEVSHRVLENGGIEKRAQVSVLCNVSYFDEPHAELRPVAISGVAVSLRAKGARAVASLKKIKECSVGGERGYTLVAGVDSSSRVTMLSGDKIGDVPTKYYVTGLLPHEQPVAGTFVDPRILTGFSYRVRPADAKKHLFGGAALVLQGIGRGYGKRLTFASTSLNNNENYFWSDSHPEGYGFSIQAVVPGDSFRIMSSSGEEVGRAQVFRADLPQVEESSTVSSEGHVTKRVRVTVTCDVTFHGEDDRTLAVTGTAVVVRRGRVARALRLEDVAIGSQISVLFSRASETLTFVRE
ncbi:uncharacterized protein [Penaeus vannamei]|uniref:uncharacterized protein n=1 Tax=Penaeus vannamei TaxID=6689 RepID=UPI00387F94B8